MTDEWKLKQVLLNLVSNAFKFTFCGRIILEVSTSKNINDSKSPENINFTVIDEGIGIKQENKNKLFRPFSMETMNQNDMGSGLG